MPTSVALVRLSSSPKGRRVEITGFDTKPRTGEDEADVDQRLRRIVELGLTVGAIVAVEHHGPFGRDPLAISVCQTLIGIGRTEAERIFVKDIKP